MKHTFKLIQESTDVPNGQCEWHTGNERCPNRISDILVNFYGKAHYYCKSHADLIIDFITSCDEKGE